MRLYALVCVVLTVGSFGYRAVFPRHEPVVLAIEDFEAAPPVEAPAAPPVGVTPAPGLLTFLTLGAAVLGTVSTLSDGGELCASEACLAAHIVDTAAALHAEASDARAPTEPGHVAIAKQ